MPSPAVSKEVLKFSVLTKRRNKDYKKKQAKNAKERKKGKKNEGKKEVKRKKEKGKGKEGKKEKLRGQPSSQSIKIPAGYQ